MKTLLLSSILLCITTQLFAQQPGTIDKTYGADNTGIVSVSNQLYVQASAMQPDDKLLLGGTGSLAGQYNLTRHTKDGYIDTSFGSGGLTTINISDLVENILSSDGWQSIAVQPDGKIVATGSVYFNNPDFTGNGLKLDNDIMIGKFLADGTPDESFGDHGRVVTNLGHIETATAIAVQADGKILVAGYQSRNVDGNSTVILLLRYDDDGSLDKSFGNGQGYVKYINSQAFALLIQPDGKIIVGGSAVPNTYFLLLRYLPDGKIDASFGDNGRVQTNFGIAGGGINQINSLALDEKGRIIAGGVIGAEQKATITRYLPDGALDNSFDGDGKLILNFESADYSYTNTVLVQPDNKLVISSIVSGSQYNNFWVPALTGLNEDGSLDVSFGTDNSQIIASQVAFTEDVSTGAVMQKEGKIIVSGNNFDDNKNKNTYILTRYSGYPSQVPLFVRIKRWLQNHGISWKGLPTEDNIAYYSIERSNNSRTGFTQIAKVSGVNNLKNYSITNGVLLQGNNYYRVKAVSHDGTVRCSETVSADNTPASVSLYPNPARNYVTVQGLNTSEKSNISIANSSGTVLANGISNGSTQYRAPTANLQPGTYYIHITTNGKTEALKFVKE